MSERWLGWHFLRQDGRTGKRGRRVVPGTVMSCRRPLALCRNGLHASRRALDALQYAPGGMVERVELIGQQLEDVDKACARSRRCLWMADATNVLHEFSCSVAEQLLTRERGGRNPKAAAVGGMEPEMSVRKHLSEKPHARLVVCELPTTTDIEKKEAEVAA